MKRAVIALAILLAGIDSVLAASVNVAGVSVDGVNAASDARR